MRTNETAQHAWYALRRTLVRWRFDQTLQDLLDYCQRAAIDEIIVKVDTEEFSHGIPTVQWLKTYQPSLFKARDALREIGVVYSLNPWVTVCHNDRGRDIREAIPGLQTMVGHRGEQAKSQACPLCPVWREHTDQLWTLYAQTQPHVMWVEDDLRTWNHRPVAYGCFCPIHMRRFSERLGERVEREDLVDAMLAAGKPHPWRQAWLDFQGDNIVDTVRFLREVVHRTSPKTCMGIMSSGPSNHAWEARKWEPFAKALAGNQPLYSRPPLGNYHETSPRGLYYTSRLVKATRHVLPEKNVVEQTEVENWPFTQYSKSVTFTAMQIAVCLALGADGLTMNLYDHMGTPLAEDTAMGGMLAARKPFFNGILERCRGKAPCGGVQLLHHERSAFAKRLKPGDDFYHMEGDGWIWDEPLNALGFATTYDKSDVIAVTGQMLRAFDDKQIKRILSKGVLLDGSAAHTLARMGYADATGVDVEAIAPRVSWRDLAAEEFFNPDFGGERHRYLSMILPDLPCDAELAHTRTHARAVAVSRLVDNDNRDMGPYLTVFENDWGGRVAVLPMVINPYQFVSFLSPTRKRQLSAVLHWLAKGALPLEVTAHDGAYPLPILRQMDGHSVVGALNLSLDPYHGTTFDLAAGGREIGRVEELSPDGTWRAAAVEVEEADGRARLTTRQEIPYDQPLLLDVIWK